MLTVISHDSILAALMPNYAGRMPAPREEISRQNWLIPIRQRRPDRSPFLQKMAWVATLVRLMKIAIGSDHAGFQYKDKIGHFLQDRGHIVTDFGTYSEEPVDYPVFIRPVALAVASGQCARGVVLGGSGNGEAIVANRVAGIRCAVCWNEQSVRFARQHNDANIISLGQRMMDLKTALEIVRLWLETAFEGGRHQRRIEMIDAPKLS